MVIVHSDTVLVHKKWTIQSEADKKETSHCIGQVFLFLKRNAPTKSSRLLTDLLVHIYK